MYDLIILGYDDAVVVLHNIPYFSAGERNTPLADFSGKVSRKKDTDRGIGECARKRHLENIRDSIIAISQFISNGEC